MIAAFFILGAIIGSQINHGIYRFAFFSRRPISPWMRPHPDAGPRRMIDYVPILGWCFLNRDEKVLGNLFWLRPMLIEIGYGFAVAGLYVFHVEQRLWLPPGTQIPDQQTTVWIWFSIQVVLFALLAIATFIDFDEFMIPDQTTIPGVVLCVITSAIYPACGLPRVLPTGTAEPMTFASPLDPPVFLYSTTGLILGLICLWFWCLALIPKVCTFRKGLSGFFPLMMASILQRPRKTKGRIAIRPRRIYWGTPVLVGIGVIGTILIPLFWLAWATDSQKVGILTSLFGMAFGMGMIWSIRIIGRLALNKEAMGFGDVTLMAMIGAYVGWQACLPILGISAVVALVVSVPLALIQSNNSLPYGPYLSIGTVLVVLGWDQVWRQWLETVFAALQPQIIFGVLVVMTVPMFILLVITRFVKERLFGIR